MPRDVFGGDTPPAGCTTSSRSATGEDMPICSSVVGVAEMDAPEEERSLMSSVSRWFEWDSSMSCERRPLFWRVETVFETVFELLEEASAYPSEGKGQQALEWNGIESSSTTTTVSFNLCILILNFIKRQMQRAMLLSKYHFERHSLLGEVQNVTTLLTTCHGTTNRMGCDDLDPSISDLPEKRLQNLVR